MSQGQHKHNQGHQKQNQGVNPEAQETKAQTEGSATPGKPEDKKKEEGGVINLVMSVPKAIWNKGIVPAYEFCKGIATRAWGSVVNFYNAEVALYKELGASKYFLDRGSKLMIKVLKIAAVVTVAGLINTLLVNMTGVSLFDPMTLGFIALGAIALLLVKSYKDQKAMDDKKSFSFTQAGSHIIEAAIAA